MNREGVVLEVKGNKAVIMTPDGQFVSVAVSGRAPAPGEIYSGKIVGRKDALIRYLAMAAAFIFALFSFSAVKLYYTAYASVVIDINPSIELTVNRWEKIIKAVPLDEDGSKILSTVKVKNDSLNEGLKKIVDESIRQDFFDEANVESDKKISVSVYINRSAGKIDLSEFEEYLAKENVRYELIQEKTGTKQDSAGKQQRDIEESDGKDDKSEDNNGKGNNKDNGNTKGNVSNRNSGSNRGSGSNKDDEDDKEKGSYKYNKNKKEDEDSERNGSDKERENKKDSKWKEKENECNKGSRNDKEGWNNKDNGNGRGSWSNKACEDNKERNENDRDNRNSRGNSRNDKDKRNYRYKAGEDLKNGAGLKYNKLFWPSILASRWQKDSGRLKTRYKSGLKWLK